eukprot:gene6570-6798_t
MYLFEIAGAKVPFGLEILKNGTLLSTQELNSQAFYTFGRSPTADVLLEHPTASRLHAVLQFKGASGEAFLYDCGSTHGTFLNRNRLKAQVMAPIRVGDTVRFGQSTRMYVLTGPTELMPAEGLNKQQKKQVALLEAAQARKDADEAKARAQMEAAISGGAGGGGVSWGMGPDAEDEEQGGPEQAVNWRSYVDNNSAKLTDRQTKLLDKIRKREYKVKNLEAETGKITAKERQEGGLTQGQAATLVRNERALEALREELEELEEQLTDSIVDSIKGKREASKSVEHKAAAKKRKRADSDDEYAAASDDEDEFYDRTAGAGAAAGAAGASKVSKKGLDKKGQPAETSQAQQEQLPEVEDDEQQPDGTEVLQAGHAAPAAAVHATKGPTMPPPGYKAGDAAAAKTKQQQPSGSNVHAAAAARVAASIALLTGGHKGRSGVMINYLPGNPAAASIDRYILMLCVCISVLRTRFC